jgi:S-(hydroxymethyl)glutathione dehydrogenase/alcohol dehydrogenase
VLAYSGKQFDGTTRLELSDGTALSQMSCVGAWSEVTIMPAMSAIKIRDDMPLPQAALIGCAVVTGVGAVQNVASLAHGESIAVVGCGGVGLNAIQGARLSGAGIIVAVDVIDAKLELARKFGATHTVNSSNGGAVEHIRELTEGRGVDVAVEAAGRLDTMQLAVELIRSGGRCVFTGIPQGSLTLDVMSLVPTAKSLIGHLLGMKSFRSEYPRLVDLYIGGDLLLDPLISKTIGLGDINLAFEDMHAGRVARSVIVNS